MKLVNADSLHRQRPTIVTIRTHQIPRSFQTTSTPFGNLVFKDHHTLITALLCFALLKQQLVSTATSPLL